MTVSIKYENERVVQESDLDLVLLQISLKHGIPHQHACGGQARCSTCRIRILSHPENVLPRTAAETKLAQKKRFDDSIRLACQTRVRGPVTVQRLVLDEQDINLAMAVDSSDARLRSLAVLFSDLRNFTPFSEAHLPYDTVHILNRYFFSVGDAILRNHGYIDKYMGDGIMALFGLEEQDPVCVCRSAVQAGLQMLEALGKLNRYLGDQFNVDFKMGIGIHFGEVIVGHTGHPKKKQFTAIGDPVNLASRIESATKNWDAQLLVSQVVRDILGAELETGRVFQAQLKGKKGRYRLHEPLRLRDVEGVTRRSDYQRLREEILHALPLQLAPAVLRLAFHDAFSHDPATKAGGARGGIRFFKPGKPALKTLLPALRWIEGLKKKHSERGWADLIALAGAVAVELTGGPTIHIPMGRVDCDGPTPHENVPDAETSIEEIKRRFRACGFSIREMVALSGAHTLGMAAGIPITDDFLVFNGSYFRELLESEVLEVPTLLGSDKALVEDIQCRRYVQEYAFNQERFFSDFAAAYRKLTLLGTDLGS